MRDSTIHSIGKFGSNCGVTRGASSTRSTVDQIGDVTNVRKNEIAPPAALARH